MFPQESQIIGDQMKIVQSFMMMESGMIIGVRGHLHLFVKKKEVSNEE